MVYTGLVVEAKAHDGIGEGDIQRWMGTPIVLEWGHPIRQHRWQGGRSRLWWQR